MFAARHPDGPWGSPVPEYGDAFNEGLRSLAIRHGSGLLLDALRGILDDPALSSDDAHPNASGYRVLAERIAPVVREALAVGGSEKSPAR